MGTHLTTLGAIVACCIVGIQLIVGVVRTTPTSIESWIVTIFFLPVILLAVMLLSLPVNLLAFHAMVRSARRRRRDDPESYRTIVLPALDDTHGIPLRLMRLYRRVGLDPKKE